MPSSATESAVARVARSIATNAATAMAETRMTPTAAPSSLNPVDLRLGDGSVAWRATVERCSASGAFFIRCPSDTPDANPPIRLNANTEPLHS